MSKRRHNFGTKRFKEKSLFIFHARIALKSLILLFVRLIARGARIGKTHTHTHTHTHRQTDRQDKYCNPRACAPRVNYQCKMFWNKFLRWLDTIQFLYHCVHPIHVKVFSIQMLLHFSQIVGTLVLFINPRRACARGLQYLSCVSVCVCFPYSGTSRNQAYKQQYQRLQRDTGMKYKKGFFFKTLRSEVMASFSHLE